LGLAGLDVAGEVEGLKKDCVSLPGVHWLLDPAMAPAELFRPGLSPRSDLVVRYNSGASYLAVKATLVPGVEGAAVSRCQVRLIDPEVRRVLARAQLAQVGSQVRAELALSFPLEELGDTWLEVFEGPLRPVSGGKAHLIRRALRWADAALRAERAPMGLAPRSTSTDWAALAALAWEHCRRDWAAADDHRRPAAVVKDAMPLPGPICLAEVLGV
jgi:hypothetical protein